MKKAFLTVAAVLALTFVPNALAWHADNVTVNATCSEGLQIVTASIDQSEGYPNAFVISITPSSFPADTTGTQNVVVKIGWQDSEDTQTWRLTVDLTGCHQTPPTDRCPPGMTPTAGKDGEEGNDECEFPPTETTPSVPTVPPTTTEPPSGTTPSPTPSPPVTEPGTSSTPTGSSNEPGNSTDDLENDLEHQAVQNGANDAPGHAAASNELPYTGFPLWLVAILGGVLVGTGVWLRKRA